MRRARFRRDATILQELSMPTPCVYSHRKKVFGEEQLNWKRRMEVRIPGMIYWTKPWSHVHMLKCSGSCMPRENGNLEMYRAHEKFWNEHSPRIQITKIYGLQLSKSKRRMESQRQQGHCWSEPETRLGLKEYGKRVLS